MRRIWQDHSLTIVLGALGLLLFGACVFIPEGKSFDVVVGLAHGCWTAVLLNALAGFLRERNKPEE